VSAAGGTGVLILMGVDALPLTCVRFVSVSAGQSSRAAVTRAGAGRQVLATTAASWARDRCPDCPGQTCRVRPAVGDAVILAERGGNGYCHHWPVLAGSPC
jgi:hypothetical protein